MANMDSTDACALLHDLGQLNLLMGEATASSYELGQATDTEQRIIVTLLTQLLGREPTDIEIQLATAQ
jgi:predicted HD phosphohydrolase